MTGKSIYCFLCSDTENVASESSSPFFFRSFDNAKEKLRWCYTGDLKMFPSDALINEGTFIDESGMSARITTSYGRVLSYRIGEVICEEDKTEVESECQ